MRFLLLIQVKNDNNYESGNPPPKKLEEAMGALMGQWSDKGILLAAEGLRPTSHGARANIGRGKLQVTDGPFTEAKEVVGGFFIVKTETRAQALDLTRAFLKVHEEVLGKDFEIGCEVRQLEG